MKATANAKQELDVQRSALARQIGRAFETPMMVLGLVWLALLIVELTRGLNRAGEIATNTIWIVFIIEFALRFFGPAGFPDLPGSAAASCRARRSRVAPGESGCVS